MLPGKVLAALLLILTSTGTVCVCLQALLDEHVPVIAFYFGLPEQQLLLRIRAAGAFTMGTATCLQEAQKMQEAGALCASSSKAEAAAVARCDII